MAGAGPLNNLLTWAVLGFISVTRVTYLFYSDYAKEGRVVLAVSSVSASYSCGRCVFSLLDLGSQSSPIYEHLPIGSIIEYLDDTKIAGKADIWTQFLGSEDVDESRGWCVDKKRYLGKLGGPSSLLLRLIHFRLSRSRRESTMPRLCPCALRTGPSKYIWGGESPMPASISPPDNTHMGLSLYFTAAALREASCQREHRADPVARR